MKLKKLLKLRPLEEHGQFALALAEFNSPEHRPIEALMPSMQLLEYYLVRYNLDHRWNQRGVKHLNN